MEKNVDEEVIVDSMADWFMEGRSELTWYFKLWHWYIKRYASDIEYYFRKKYQKYTTGFPHEEAWNFNWWHAKVVVPRLKHMRNNLNGYPCALGCGEEVGSDEKQKEWEDILDKMIWSFEHFNDHIDPIFSDDYDHRWKVTEEEGGTLFSPLNETGTIDYTPVEEHRARVQEGLDLFAKYYVNLWD